MTLRNAATVGPADRGLRSPGLLIFWLIEIVIDLAVERPSCRVCLERDARDDH